MRRPLVASGALAAACIVLLSQCSRDPISTGPEGGVTVGYRSAAGTPAGADDSLRVWVLDRGGSPLVGPLLVLRQGEIEVELQVEAGPGRRVRLQVESDGYSERGVTAAGEQGGIEIRPGTTTEIEVELHGSVPRIQPIQAEPAQPSYTVEWSGVPGASDYEVREETSQGAFTHVTADTSLVIDLLASPATASFAEPAASTLALAGGPNRAVYRVRARLAHGTSIFSDSTGVDRAEIVDLPFITDIQPLDGSEGVGDTLEPRITFDRPMDWSTIGDTTFALESASGGEGVPFVAEGEAGSGVVILHHAQAFVRGESYRLRVRPGLRGLDGRPFDQVPAEPGTQGFESVFAVEVYDPLAVVSVEPASGAEEVPIRTSVDVVLNRAASPPSVNAATVLFEETGTGPVPATIDLREDGTVIRITPNAELEYDRDYAVTVTTDVRDLRGEPLDQDPGTPIPTFEPFASGFHTEVQPLGPRVESVSPEDGATNVAPFEAIEVTFSEPVDASTVIRAETFSVLEGPIFANIGGTILAQDGGLLFRFEPTQNLQQGREYRVVLDTGILDEDGHPLDQDRSQPGFQGFQSHFFVERNLQVVAVQPADRAERVDVDASVQIDFNLPADPASVDEGTLVLESGGVPVPAVRELSGNGLRATLRPEQPLAHFRQYNVRVGTDLLSEAGAHLDQNLSLDGYQAFLSTFTTEPESLPPMVLEVVPEPGAAGLPLRPEIRVTFSKPVTPGSVAGNFAVRKSGTEDPVPGTASLASDSLVATYTLAADLEYSRDYIIRVETWVVDRFDVRLDQDPVTPGRQPFTSEFRTDHERIRPQVVSVDPPDGAEDVPLDTAITVDFSEPMDPATVPGAFALTREGISVPGQGSLTPDSARYVFIPDEPLRLDRAYVVSVDTTAADPFGNPLDQSGGSGEPQPFASGFRTLPDQVGPRVLSAEPADGAEEVEVTIQPALVFSEPVDSASVAGGVQILGPGEIVVALAEILRPSPEEVVLVPASALEFDTDYRLRALAAVTDTVGNPLDQDPGVAGDQIFESGFRTQPETIPPRVIGVRYEGDDGDGLDVPRDTRVWIAFDEPIDPATVTTETVKLAAGPAAVASTLEVPAPDSVRVTPVETLAYGTSYSLTVSGVADLIGNPLDQVPETPELDPFVTSFTTEPDTVPPHVVSTIPADGEQDVDPGTVITVVFSEPMDTTSFALGDLALFRIQGDQQFQTLGTLSWDENLTDFFFTPQSPLVQGSFYQIAAGIPLKDLSGNSLDQDPETPVADEFSATFLVGLFPVADAGPGICDPPDSSYVVVDGSGSHDPDGTVVLAVWDWGDGTIEEVADPDSAAWIRGHVYACADVAGCDGLDNDGDGQVDESGPQGCDESYRIVLRIEDDNGFSSADTSGVSFCAFSVLGADPPDGATGVDTTRTDFEVRFSRTVALASLTGENFRLLREGTDPVDLGEIAQDLEDKRNVRLTLAATDSLRTGTSYEIVVAPEVLDTEGHSLDPDPCTPGGEPFVSTFQTEAGPPGLRRGVPPGAP